MELYELTVHELMDKLNKNEITSEDITKSYVSRINEKEDDIEAFVTVLSEDAENKAKEIDQKIEKGEITNKLALTSWLMLYHYQNKITTILSIFFYLFCKKKSYHLIDMT